MTSNILVLGTDHRFQTKSSEFSNGDHEAFDKFVRKLVVRHGVLAIAEELSPQALSEAGVEHSVPEHIARSLGKVHRYCDPDKGERRALGIRNEADIRGLELPRRQLSEVEVQEKVGLSHRLRGEFWLRELLNLNIWPTIFVCGANHTESFTNVLSSGGLSSEIVARDWAPDSSVGT